jgi:hypothetical protein
MLDVAAQHVRREGVEGRLGRVVGDGGFEGGERSPAAAGGVGHRVRGVAEANDRGRQDGLVEVQGGERPGPVLLGHGQRRTSEGMADPEDRRAPQGVDRGEHVVGEAWPVDGHVVGVAALAMAAQVDRHAAEPVTQVTGQGREDSSVEPVGVSQEQGRALASEVVQRHLDAIGARDAPHGAILTRGPGRERLGNVRASPTTTTSPLC